MPPLEWSVGEACQVKDLGAWYASKIVAERLDVSGGKEYKVHFIGWKKRYDRWISPDPEVLLPSDAIVEQPEPIPEPAPKPKPKSHKKRRSDGSVSTPKRAKAGKQRQVANSTRVGANRSADTNAVVAIAPATPTKSYARRTGGKPQAKVAVRPKAVPAQVGSVAKLSEWAEGLAASSATSIKPRPADGKSRKTAQPVRRALKSKRHGLLEDVDFTKVTRAELSFDVLSAEEIRPLLAGLGWPSEGVNRMDLVARLRDAVRQGLNRAAASTADGSTIQAASSMQIADFRASYASTEDHRHRSKADTQPDDILEALQDPSYESVAAALDSVNVPVNVSRTNVKISDDQIVRGMCIGVVGGRAHGIITSKYARQRPHLTASLVNFAKKYAPDFPFTSIQVNKNYMSAMHVDKNNLGPSYIVGVGNYADGALWVQPKGDVDCRHKWVLFDGNIPHCTLPYTGTRYTLIYFSQQSFRLLGHIGNNRSHKATLMKLGFPFPPQNAKKKQYEPWRLRLLQAKAAFRKWQDCKAKGIEYSWENKERANWRHESDDEDLSLNEKNNDGWGPDDSDSEDEPDSWVVRGRRRDQLFAGAPIPASLIRKLGRTGGVSVLAQYFIRKARGQTFNLRERPVGATYIDRASDDEEGWSDMENNCYMGPRASRSAGDGMDRSGQRRITEKEWMEGIEPQPHFGHCVAETHEPSMQDVARQLGVRVQHLVGLNKGWYPRLSYFARLVQGTMLMIPDTPGAVRGCVPLHPSWVDSTKDVYSLSEKSWGMHTPRNGHLRQAVMDTSPVEATRWLRRMYRTGGTQILNVHAEEVNAVSTLLTQSGTAANAVFAACMEHDNAETGKTRQRKRKISEAAEAKQAAKRARQEERERALIHREVAGALKQLVLAVHKAAKVEAALQAAEEKAAKVAERRAREALRMRITRAPLVYKKNISPMAYRRALLMDEPGLYRGCRPYNSPRPPDPIVYQRSLLQDAADLLWRGSSRRPRVYEHNKRKREKGEPRRPVSAYGCFCAAVKSTLLEEEPSLSPTERSKALSDRWQSLSLQSREQYFEMHRADQARYRREIAAWDHPLARAARQAAAEATAEAAKVAAEEAANEQQRAAEERAAKMLAKEEEKKRIAAGKAAKMLAEEEEREKAAAEKAAAVASAKAMASLNSRSARKRRKKQPGEPIGCRSAFILFAADRGVQAAVMQRQEDQGGVAAGTSLGLRERTKLVSERWQSLAAEQKTPWQEKAQADKERYVREMAEWQSTTASASNGDGDTAAWT